MGNENDNNIENVSRNDEKEGEAIKTTSAPQQEQLTRKEADISHSITACNEVGSPSQKKKEASPSREVIDGGRDSTGSASASAEIPSGAGLPQVCSCKPQGKDWLKIFLNSHQQ